MADQLIAATVQVLLEKAVSVAADRIGSVLGFGFNKDLEAFKERAKDIQAVLVDAEKKQSQSQFVLCWLRKVEAVAIEADYVLDALHYEALRRKVESMNKAKRPAKVCLFFSLSKHDISFRWRMGSKVKEINVKFEKFIREVSEIGLIRMQEESILQLDNMATNEVASRRETNSLPLPFVAGRVKEVSTIVGMLSSGSSVASASVSVLSIVGMGGLGKTTLAKSVYNNPGIDSHFDRKIWVCISTNFEVTELFRLILESLWKGGKVEKFGQDATVQKVREELAGKKFLLIIDDVWNEDQKLWNDFYTTLVGLNTTAGSCCVVTTRLQKVANLVSTIPPFALERLRDDECWQILCRRAAKDGEMPLQIDVHKEEMLKKCQGLPLAANAIGGLLSLQKREEWLSIVEDKILKVSEYIEGEINPVLRLSFDYLPSLSIKKCFAYCSIYSKDTEMYVRDLVEFWMAEGFLQEGTDGRVTMEEVGDNYVTILLQSSLLENIYDDKYECQMHDLVHDLAESVSNQGQVDGEYNPSQVRHLAPSSDFTGKYNVDSTWVQILKGDISNDVLVRFKCLHVLNLHGTNLGSIPSAIGKLKHLRLLEVSLSKIKSLPKSLCNLYNLQTLNLVGCMSIECLPREFSNMISLRHLKFWEYDRTFKMPPNMGQLTCLQTLRFYNVGKEKGCEIIELGSMKLLKGSIEIRNLELVEGKEARLANLFDKVKLVELTLSWGSTSCRDIGNHNDEHVLEGLEPHPNLQQLMLENYMGDRLPQWFGKLVLLTKLRFYGCKSFKDLPTLGHLLYLLDLEIEGLEHLTCIGDSFYFDGLREGKLFRSLKRMRLKNLPNLTEWKVLEEADGHVFSKLESLGIHHCCQLSSVPTSFPSLEELKIEGNVQVSVVKDIIGNSSSSLKQLRIESMGGLNSVGDVMENPITGLKLFEIRSCHNLIDIPTFIFEGCTSLEELKVDSCPNLVSCALNLQQTPSVNKLSFKTCPKMFTTNAMPRGFSFLTNLRSLAIGPFTDDSMQLFDWSGLIACSSTILFLDWFGSLQENSCLPQQLQLLTSLRQLSLYSLNSVEVLPDWLGNLTSLESLYVLECPKLRSLPSTHALGRLTNLRSIGIVNCPLLLESSYRGTSSLPNLEIYRP